MALEIASGCTARDDLHRRYASKLVVNYDLDRTLVSFQANRAARFYAWFKYREGFSTGLITYLLGRLGRAPGVLLDPFAGAGAALFTGASLGWDTYGIEVLPVGLYAMQARLASERVDVARLAVKIEGILGEDFSAHFDQRFSFQHIPITAGAFPPRTEEEMAGYLSLCNEIDDEPDIQTLLTFACFCVLEEVSYTRKDGQYLRWDYRSGRLRGSKPFDKGKISVFREAITEKLYQILGDLQGNSTNGQALLIPFEEPVETIGHRVNLIGGSCLEVLPQQPAASIDLVITSPPYCNRYDYTRTYALELAFLSCDAEMVKDLRQDLLSCTVENKDKIAELRKLYASSGRLDTFGWVNDVFAKETALHEVLSILDKHRSTGTINNSNIPKMVRNYFYEMCFVIQELARILRPGGHVFMVNDNVRYVGEDIPVDLILSHFAEEFGFITQQIWVLPTGKGNSSQQMGKHGRAETRKCMYVWEKQ